MRVVPESHEVFGAGLLQFRGLRFDHGDPPCVQIDESTEVSLSVCEGCRQPSPQRVITERLAETSEEVCVLSPSCPFVRMNLVEQYGAETVLGDPESAETSWG